MDTAEEIKKYKELLDNGIITQEEFDRKKAELLFGKKPSSIKDHEAAKAAQQNNEEAPDNLAKTQESAKKKKRIIYLVAGLLAVVAVLIAVIGAIGPNQRNERAIERAQQQLGPIIDNKIQPILKSNASALGMSYVNWDKVYDSFQIEYNSFDLDSKSKDYDFTATVEYTGPANSIAFSSILIQMKIHASGNTKSGISTFDVTETHVRFLDSSGKVVSGS